jgi:hypothetical protein
LTGTQGAAAAEQTNIVMPLYFVQYLPYQTHAPAMTGIEPWRAMSE